jgi:autotransporter-associated beta strand protein
MLRSSRQFAIVLIAGCTLFALPAIGQGQTVTWDANGTTAGVTDGPGAWLTGTHWWNGTSTVPWVSGMDAVFGVSGTGGAVTLSATTAANSITVNAYTGGNYNLGSAGQVLTIGSGGITLNSGARAVTFTSPINVGANQTWTNNSAGQLTLSGSLVGSANVTIAGTSGVYLNYGQGGSDGSYSGTMSVGEGLLVIDAANRRGLASATLLLSTNATGTFSGNTNQVNATGNAVIGALGGSGRFWIGSGASNNAAGFDTGNLFGGNNASTSFSGTISSAAAEVSRKFVKAGSGTMTLSGTGSQFESLGATPVTVQLMAGSLRLQNPDALSAAEVYLTNAGGPLLFDNVEGTTFSLGGLRASPNIGRVNVQNTTGQPVTVQFNDGGTLIGGTWSGVGTVVKNGTGTFSPTAQSTISGTVSINGGSFRPAGNTVLPATVRLDGGVLDGFAANVQWSLGALEATQSGTLNFTSSNSREYTIGTNNRSTTFAGMITGSASSIWWFKSGTGTMTITGTNQSPQKWNIDQGIVLPMTLAAAGTNNWYVSGSAVLGVGFALDQAVLNKVEARVSNSAASAGAVALGADSNENLSFTSSNLASVSLGAVSGTWVYGASGGAVTPNGSVYRLGGGGGTLDFRGSLVDAGGTSRTLQVGGNVAGYGGAVILGNAANSYTGKTTVNTGTLAFASIGNVNGGASALGAPTTVANATIDLGSGSSAAVLLYTGTGHTSNRAINLSGTSGGGAIDSAGGGPLTLSGSVSGGTGTKTFTLTGTNTGLNTIGTITGTGVSVVKDGTGLWRMNANKGFGGTLTVKNGTLQVANAGAVGNAVTVGDAAPGAGGLAALLLEENVTASFDVITPAGTQAALFGGANTTGTATLSSGEMQMGRATTLVAKTGGTVDFRGTWAGATSGSPANQNVTIGAAGYAGRFLLQSSGTLATSGSAAVQYGTAVVGLTTTVSSAGTLATAAGATLAGTGIVTNAIGGAGLISPGNSPGILTAGSLDPGAGTDFIFEITGAAPDFTNLGASVNDVLRLTDLSAPFASALGAGNVVNVLFRLSSGTAPVTQGTYTGGFFTDRNVDFFSSISSGSFAYWVLGAYGSGSSQQQFAVGPEGSLVTYSRLEAFDPALSVQKSVVAQTSGPTGQITQFVVVPEPATIVLAGVGIAAAVLTLRRRRA